VLLGESPFIKIPIQMVHILSEKSDWSSLPWMIAYRALAFVTAIKPKSHLSEQTCFSWLPSGLACSSKASNKTTEIFGCQKLIDNIDESKIANSRVLSRAVPCICRVQLDSWRSKDVGCNVWGLDTYLGRARSNVLEELRTIGRCDVMVR